MAFTSTHARQNRDIYEVACLLVENDNYETARNRFNSGELVQELEKHFPDIPVKRLSHQAAKAYRRRPK